MSEQERPTGEQIAAAGRLVGLEFTEDECKQMAQRLAERADDLEGLREGPFARLANHDAPPLYFDPQLPPKGPVPTVERHYRLAEAQEPRRPATLEELAFWPVSQQSRLLKNRQVTSLELTEMYLARLRRFGPQLECVVTITEELALEQARRADEELARGIYRSPLHGIPWGAKDLLATKGYPTTWGATPWRDQKLDVDATVVQRLEDAGAVLVAKLTLGEIANGDVWFGGLTRNPWNVEEGSSGSSAGSASATVAGLVGFSIGSETLGSIVSPSARCGGYRTAADLRAGQSPRRHGAELVDGQARSHLPLGGRLRPGARRHLWSGWKRPHGVRHSLRLAATRGHRRNAHRLRGVGICAGWLRRQRRRGGKGKQRQRSGDVAVSGRGLARGAFAGRTSMMPPISFCWLNPRRHLMN